jgi:hypothetical protein
MKGGEGGGGGAGGRPVAPAACSARWRIREAAVRRLQRPQRRIQKVPTGGGGVPKDQRAPLWIHPPGRATVSKRTDRVELVDGHVPRVEAGDNARVLCRLDVGEPESGRPAQRAPPHGSQSAPVLFCCPPGPSCTTRTHAHTHARARAPLTASLWPAGAAGAAGCDPSPS